MNEYTQQTPKEMRKLILEALHLRALKSKLSKRKNIDGSPAYHQILDEIERKGQIQTM